MMYNALGIFCSWVHDSSINYAEYTEREEIEMQHFNFVYLFYRNF
jgi:hypothetical protein